MRLLTIVAVATLSALSHGQVAYSLEDASFGTGAGASPAVYLPSGGYTTGGNDPRGPVALPEYANLPPIVSSPDVGGYAIDQRICRMFSCNGFWVQSEQHPFYGAPSVATSAGLGVWFDSGEITGMALANGSSQPGLMWDSNFGPELTSLTGQDNAHENIEIPWDFPINGHGYNFIGVNTNGAVTIGDDPTWPGDLLNAGASLTSDFLNWPCPIVAPFYGDLDLSSMGTIHLKVESDRLLVTWNNVGSQSSPGSSFTFQVHMFPDGHVVYSYNGISDITSNLGGSLIVGLAPGAPLPDPGGNDYSADIAFATTGPTVYQNWPNPISMPFDLDLLSMIFTPNSPTTYTVNWSLTGMPTATLYCVDNKQLRSFDVTGFAPSFTPLQGVLAPIQLSWLNNDDDLTGLGYDPATQHLWACASNGNIFRFETDGTPVGFQPVIQVISSGTLSGCTVNTTNGVGSFPAPSQSFQVSGYHILVSDGQYVYDALNPLASPLPVAGGTGTSRGLAYSSDGQLIPAAGSCPQTGTWIGNPNIGTGNGPALRTDAPTVQGSTNSLELLGGPPSSQVFLLCDFAPIFGGALLPTGDVLYVWPLSPTFILLPTMTNSLGVASFPVSLSGAPPGLQFTHQWYYFDASNPTIYGCLSDAMTITQGHP